MFKKILFENDTILTIFVLKSIFCRIKRCIKLMITIELNRKINKAKINTYEAKIDLYLVLYNAVVEVA